LRDILRSDSTPSAHPARNVTKRPHGVLKREVREQELRNGLGCYCRHAGQSAGTGLGIATGHQYTGAHFCKLARGHEADDAVRPGDKDRFEHRLKARKFIAAGATFVTRCRSHPESCPRSIPMTKQAISPLRRRMIEDMSIRKFAAKTQHDYVQRVKDFAAFLGRSPDTAKSEDVRRFRLHLC
jgi:hypothetical protein